MSWLQGMSDTAELGKAHLDRGDCTLTWMSLRRSARAPPAREGALLDRAAQGAAGGTRGCRTAAGSCHRGAPRSLPAVRAHQHRDSARIRTSVTLTSSSARPPRQDAQMPMECECPSRDIRELSKKAGKVPAMRAMRSVTAIRRA